MAFIKTFLSRHYPACIVALFVAAVVFLPSFLFPFMADSYQRLNVGNFGVDEFHYLSMGKELWEGHSPSNPFLAEGKDWFNPQQVYASYLVLPFRWLGLSELGIAGVATLYGLVGVFLLFLLIYFFALQLSRDKRLSLISALFVVLGYNFLTNYLFIHHFNMYARPIIPLASALVFFLYLNLLLKSLQSEDRGYAVAAGAVFGLSFYTYFYAWTFISALNGILFALLLLAKEREQAKRVLALTGIGYLLGAPELYLLYSFSGTEMGRQILLFQGGIETRVFTLVKQSWLVLFFFCLFLYARPREKHWPLMLSLLLAGIVSINQGVITGREFQRFHYFWHFILPTVTVIGAYLLWQVVTSALPRRLLFYFLVFILFANGVIQGILGTFETLPLKNRLQDYRPIIDRLNLEQSPAVILAANELPELLFVIYTNHDIFFHHHAGGAYNTSLETLRDAFFAYTYLDKDARANPRGSILTPSPRDTHPSGIYRELRKYYTTPGMSARGAPALRSEAELQKGLLDGYAALLAEGGMTELLRRRGVRYIVWDRELTPKWDLSSLPGLRLLLSSGTVSLYAFTQ